MEIKIIKVGDDERLDEAALKHFGGTARVPLSKHDYKDKPVVGYLEASDGTYAVVDIGNAKLDLGLGPDWSDSRPQAKD